VQGILAVRKKFRNIVLS